MTRVIRTSAALALVAAAAFTAGRAGLTTHTDAIAQPEFPPEFLQAMERAAAVTDHHHAMEQLLGTWEGWVRFRAAPDEPWSDRMPGRAVREMVLGGRFLREIISSPTGPDGPFEGIGYIGYNNADQRYESVWMENAQTAMLTGAGYYNPDEHSFFFTHQQRNIITGAVETATGSIDCSDPDRHVYKGWLIGADGRSFQNFEGVFERVKDDND